VAKTTTEKTNPQCRKTALHARFENRHYLYILGMGLTNAAGANERRAPLNAAITSELAHESERSRKTFVICEGFCEL
jgi:hypothetical protein